MINYCQLERLETNKEASITRSCWPAQANCTLTRKKEGYRSMNHVTHNAIVNFILGVADDKYRESGLGLKRETRPPFPGISERLSRWEDQTL